MPVFKGMSEGGKLDLSGLLHPKPSVMCVECKIKFKSWMKNGGEKPTPCEICKSKLKNKMFDGRNPDR